MEKDDLLLQQETHRINQKTLRLVYHNETRRYLELLNLQLPESQLLTKKIAQKTTITKVRKSLLSFMLQI